MLLWELQAQGMWSLLVLLKVCCSRSDENAVCHRLDSWVAVALIFFSSACGGRWVESKTNRSNQGAYWLQQCNAGYLEHCQEWAFRRTQGTFLPRAVHVTWHNLRERFRQLESCLWERGRSCMMSKLLFSPTYSAPLPSHPQESRQALKTWPNDHGRSTNNASMQTCMHAKQPRSQVPMPIWASCRADDPNSHPPTEGHHLWAGSSVARAFWRWPSRLPPDTENESSFGSGHRTLLAASHHLQWIPRG